MFSKVSKNNFKIIWNRRIYIISKILVLRKFSANIILKNIIWKIFILGLGLLFLLLFEIYMDLDVFKSDAKQPEVSVKL